MNLWAGTSAGAGSCRAVTNSLICWRWKGTWIMRFGPSRQFATMVGLILLPVFPASSIAQAPAAPAASQVPGLQCNGTPIRDPFKGRLAGPDLPPGLVPISEEVKSEILRSGLPCQENVTPGAQTDPTGKEAAGLDNLQRGFDFYSWRTFIALNATADAI